MTTSATSTSEVSDRPPGPGPSPDPGTLRYLLAGLIAGAGLIHLVMAPVHAAESLTDGLGFAAVGWAQVAVAVAALLGVARRFTLVGSILLNAAALGMWIWSRTAGLPFGGHAGTPEEVGLIDGLAAGLQVAAILVAVAMLVAPEGLSVGRLAPALVAVAVLGATTAVLVQPDTTTHDHADGAHVEEMAAIDETRCDLGFNPTSYWAEARALGVDTYAGGAMAPHVTEADRARAADFASTPGTPGLDALISGTSKANEGESAAGAFVATLGRATEEDFQAWRQYMWAQSTAAGSSAESSGHSHGSSSEESTASSAAPDDNGGHGGHVGPNPWIAMTDSADCDALTAELERAKAAALQYPTAQDAMDAGYFRVTTYLPGIAAHYMKFPIVDGEFDVDEPEMVLYDGDGPDARVVGLSYYLIHPGDAEPTQGFTGPNDHFHRHVGLCVKGGLVVGDSTTTPEDCKARGGFKNGGQAAWMNHVWIVPGCESPWGLFSGASPVIDGELPLASGTNDGGCSASGVLDRYDLTPGSTDNVPGVEELASAGGS